MKKVIVLTGSELRHSFFRKFIALSDGIEVVRTYCEGLEKSLRTIVERDATANDHRVRHLAAREQSEEDFFGIFAAIAEDCSRPVFIPKGDINSDAYAEEIIAAAPDLLIAYGCSIVKGPLLEAFAGRFINVHLGLSPYYRGAGTNYWPLVNGEPEYVGVTFMHIDTGIDTGGIIHQCRARYAWGDTPSQIGNRLIADMAAVCCNLIVGFDGLPPSPPPPAGIVGKVYMNKDYTEESVVALYRNFSAGLIATYLWEERLRCARAPIVVNPVLAGRR